MNKNINMNINKKIVILLIFSVFKSFFIFSICPTYRTLDCSNSRCCPKPVCCPRVCRVSLGPIYCRPKKVCCPRIRCCKPKPECCPPIMPPCKPLPCIKQVCKFGGFSEPIINRPKKEKKKAKQKRLKETSSNVSFADRAYNPSRKYSNKKIANKANL